jgi:hypothetical protein
MLQTNYDLFRSIVYNKTPINKLLATISALPSVDNRKKIKQEEKVKEWKAIQTEQEEFRRLKKSFGLNSKEDIANKLGLPPSVYENLTKQELLASLLEAIRSESEDEIKDKTEGSSLPANPKDTDATEITQNTYLKTEVNKIDIETKQTHIFPEILPNGINIDETSNIEENVAIGDLPFSTDSEILQENPSEVTTEIKQTIGVHMEEIPSIDDFPYSTDSEIPQESTSEITTEIKQSIGALKEEISSIGDFLYSTDSEIQQETEAETKLRIGILKKEITSIESNIETDELCETRMFDSMFETNIPMVQEESGWICELCAKEFKTKRNLNVHMNIHEANASVQCHECEKQFKYKAILDSHISKMHRNMPSSKTLKPKMYKPKKFKITKESEKLEESLNCHICFKSFMTSRYLKVHMANIHENFNVSECDMCGKQFNYKRLLMCHMKNVHENTQIQCSHCQKSCTNYNALKKHIAHNHST